MRNRVQDVENLVYFMHTNELKDGTDALALIPLAHMYQMDKLLWICTQAIMRDVSCDNLQHTLQIVEKYNFADGFATLVDYGKENIDELKERSDYNDLSVAFRYLIEKASTEEQGSA